MLFINYMKNLDLYHQGEYALRVSIQCERSGRRARFISNPHVGSSAHQTQEDAESRFDTSRQAARISRDGCDYTTASGYIRFRDETVNLNEAIVFEVPVDVNKDFSTETLLLRFGLLYGKPVSHDKTGSAALRRPRTSGASADSLVHTNGAAARRVAFFASGGPLARNHREPNPLLHLS